MGSHRSKEEDVMKISTSIFVSNLPDRFGAKELWNICQAYGHVIDSYIPDRRSKAGKRFGFVCFIKVHDVDRLVNNMCTVWVGRNKLHANVARFQRATKVNQRSVDNNYGRKLDNSVRAKNGDENKEEISLRLIGKVKEFASLNNLKVVLAKEVLLSVHGFLRLCWLIMNLLLRKGSCGLRSRECRRGGGPEILSIALPHDGMKSIISESFKMMYHGKLCWARAIEVPGWEPDFEDENDESSEGGLFDDEIPRGEDNSHNDMESEGTVEEVQETCFEEGIATQNLNDNAGSQSEAHSEDPMEDGSSFAPVNEVEENKSGNEHVNRMNLDQHVNIRIGVQSDTDESNCSRHFKKSTAPRTGGSILHLIDDLVKCWGNFAFDYAYSEAVGNSGGILCIWDPNMFIKLNETISDYFTIVRGTWVPTGIKLLIVSVYAPQESKENVMLWDYIRLVVSNWDGQVVIMGDFNEVRYSSERFGSVFNKKGAEVFNNFINNAGLVEVPLGGCSFTWCHKSAKKMSKLDRFLIFDNLISSCPSLSVVALDRFLSDHRPILMHEFHGDYGPIPFKFFHYWFDLDGFDKFVEKSWK
nr:RNA-directed DNA polymerase, eukaryota, reverse transcriptase zinc-binding domain protein [Tanacetum cinerariifolium]